MKLVITKAKGEITGVYVSEDLVGTVEIDQLNYDTDLTPNDEKVEDEITELRLIKLI
jgi:hypothetical protein